MRRRVSLFLAVVSVAGALAAVAQDSSPHRVGGDVKAPVVVQRVEPDYPEEARKARISGIVILEVLIDKTGTVREAVVLKPLPFGLAEAAVDAVRQWRFLPGTIGDEPVDVLFNLTVHFKLNTQAGDDVMAAGGPMIPPPPPPSPITTVILVRHAEKDGESMDQDPALTAAGRARAQELSRVLADTHLDAIYTTPFARTRDTASPVSSGHGLMATEFPAGALYAANMASLIRQKHAGQTVLVVGHSNTTRDLIRVFGVLDAPEIADSEYDRLFVVTLGQGKPRLLSLRYGAAAP